MVCVEEAFLNLKPSTYKMFTCEEVTNTIGCLYKRTTYKNAFFVKCVGILINLNDTGNHFIVLCVEVVIVAIDLLPTGRKHSEGRIIPLTVFLELSGKLGLVYIQAVVAEIVVISINLLDTGKLNAVLIICEASVLKCPAFLNVVSEGVAVLEGSVGCAEPCTGLAVILRIGIYEGLKSVNQLVFRLLSEGVKSISSEVTLIAKSTGVNNIETILSCLDCAILSRNLDSLYHAKRICGYGINSLSLVNPVKLQSKRICCLVKFSRSKSEVLVTNFKCTVIHNYVVIKVDSCGDLGKHANTLRKLKQEVPCRCVRCICTGKHINKVCKLTGNRDLSHINRKYVRCSHLLIEIDSGVCNTIKCISILDIKKPCELTVTTGCHVEVKGVFTLLKHVNNHSSAYLFISNKLNLNVNNFNTGILVTNEDITVNCTNIVLFENKLNVTATKRDRLVVIACCYGKLCICTVNSIHMCSGEVYILGNNNVHSCHTNDILTKHHVNIYRTICKTGEYTILGNSCKRIIGNRPSISLGKLNLITCRADTLCSHLYGSTDSGILVLALNDCMVELSGAGSCRYHKKRSGYRTSEAVRRSVYYANCIITGLLCNEGCRSTTVKVDRLNTSCVEHDLCDLLHATTTGERLLTTIKYHEYYLTCLGDTNRCSGSTTRVIAIRSVDSNLTILNKR